jgi:hypothetical protein
MSAESRLSHATQKSVMARPPARRSPLPMRLVSLGAATTTTKLAMVIGRKARPASIGVSL